jgi:hypothetical protein
MTEQPFHLTAMSPRFITDSRSMSSAIRSNCASLGLIGLVAISACAPKGAAPAPTPTVAAPEPTVSQTCPDASAGPSIIVQAVEDARHAMIERPTGAVPPACLVTAFVQIPIVVPESLSEHALGIATELDRRGGGDQREVLASEVTLLSRARRYADVSRAYTRLVAIDPQPTLPLIRMAIVAAHQRSDTAALLRLLSAAASRPEPSPTARMERTVLQQVGALHSAINESRGFVRQNPKYVAAYPSLIGNFGTLGNVDSVVVYIGRALKQGVTRPSLATAVDPAVNTLLRHATLYGNSSDGWETQIAAATRLDSALTTPSTKFLVASLIAQSAEQPIAELSPLIEGSSIFPRMSANAASERRGPACRRIGPLTSSLDVAAARLREGGDRFAVATGVSQLGAALSAERERLVALQEVCARNP